MPEPEPAPLMPHLVLGTFLAFFAARCAIETALSLMNLSHVARARGAVPPALQGEIDVESARRSRDYTLARGRFGLVHAAFGAGATLALLFSGVLPGLDAGLSRLGLGGAHRFVAFLAILSAIGGVLDVPFSLWSTFVLEARFGFNRATPALWVRDRLKGIALGAALGLPLLYAAYGFFALTGRAWWIWLFAFLTGLQIVMLWVYPVLIAPLFNRFSPLPEGELRARLEALAREAGFRTRGLFVMDASRRSAHGNAYFVGLFRPRIVLFDTLAREMSVEETAAVLAHEIGHYRARHVQKHLAVSVLAELGALYVLSLLVRWPPLFAAFGFPAPSFHAAIALASLCGGAFTFFLTPLESALLRRHEYEADRYSASLARAPALRSALVKLSRQNLGNLHPHPWYSAWHYSHPALTERLAAIARLPSAR